MTNTYHKKEEKYIRFGQTFLSHQKKNYNKEKRKRVMRNADRKKKQIEKEKQYATIIGL